MRIAMRRMWALALAAVFSFSLIEPVLVAADDESQLPACCRRSGAHHCAMPVDDSVSGPALRSAACPMLPASHAAPAARIFSLVAVLDSTISSLASQPVSFPSTDAFVSIRDLRVEQERGPPQLS